MKKNASRFDEGVIERRRKLRALKKRGVVEPRPARTALVKCSQLKIPVDERLARIRETRPIRRPIFEVNPIYWRPTSRLFYPRLVSDRGGNYCAQR